jgi:plasmid stabilization system protein ParE
VKISWSKKADKDLDRIYLHICKHFSVDVAVHIYYKIKLLVTKLQDFPELGRKIGKDFHKRYLVIDGNILIYEIVLNKNPMVIIRSIRPRKASAV